MKIKINKFKSASIVLFFNTIISISVLAQSPYSFKYQAVARDAAGIVIANTQVTMQIRILQGTVSGSPVCIEEFTPTTNAFGLVNLEIGSINLTDFSNIDWSNGPYFVEITLNGTLMGASQLLSVPYALHAKTAENGFSGNYNDLNNKPNLSEFITVEVDGSITNELQALNISNDTIYLTNGGFVKLPAQFDGNYNSLINKPDLESYDFHLANNDIHVNITDKINWNTAFSWGDHAGLYRPISYVPTWSDITSNPFSITTPANNQILKYNGVSSKWENWTPAYLTAEVDGSVTNEIELPTQTGNLGKFLTTNGTSPSWIDINKITVGLGNVENTALSTWSGSSNLTSLGVISGGVWQGSLINALYIDNLPASKITSGIFDNARINWASPSNIGSTTPVSGAFTSLSASNGLNVSNGSVIIKPAGSGGVNGQVLTTDGVGNATWKSVASAGSMAVLYKNANYTIQATDGFIITAGGYTFTLPTASAAGAGKILYIYTTVSACTLQVPGGNTLWDLNGVNTTTNVSIYVGTFISDGVNAWYQL